MTLGGHSESSSLYLGYGERVATLWQRGKSMWQKYIDSRAKEIHDRRKAILLGRRYLDYLTVLVTTTEYKDEKDMVLTLKAFPVGGREEQH